MVFRRIYDYTQCVILKAHDPTKDPLRRTKVQLMLADTIEGA